jgi:hypothetical protein
MVLRVRVRARLRVAAPHVREYASDVGHDVRFRRVIITIATKDLDDPEVRAFLAASSDPHVERGPRVSIIVAAAPASSLDTLEALRRSMDSGRLLIKKIVDSLD